MGSPENESDRDDSEGQQHEVAVAKPFAVSKFRGDVRGMGCLRGCSSVPASSRPLGARQDACDQRELDRRQAVRELA